MRPRIVFKGIDQGRQFGKQFLIRVFERAALMKSVGQELAFLVELDASEDGVRPGLKCAEVRGDPIWGRLAVGIGSQDHAVPFASFGEPSLGHVHRRATSRASVRDCWRQSRFNHADGEREAPPKPSGEVGALIGAIVGEDGDADEGWRNQRPRAVALPRRARKQAGKRSSSSFTGMATTKPGPVGETGLDGGNGNRASPRPAESSNIERPESKERARHPGEPTKNRSAAMKFRRVRFRLRTALPSERAYRVTRDCVDIF